MISLQVQELFCFCNFLTKRKTKKIQGRNATRWCEYSASDRSVWMAEVKCTHPHAQVSSHQWCCLMISPRAVRTLLSLERETRWSQWCSHMHAHLRVPRREVKHLWRGSVDALLTISAPVRLNQAVTWRNRCTTCAPTRETPMGTCRLVHLLNPCSCKCSSWQLCGWRNVFRKTPAFRGFIYLLILVLHF